MQGVNGKKAQCQADLKSIKNEPCLSYDDNQKDFIFVLLYVDDNIEASKSKNCVEKLEQILLKEFEIIRSID